jgi:hypothetical protein
MLLLCWEKMNIEALNSETSQEVFCWSKMNIETLKSETAQEHLLKEVIPRCKNICTSKLHNTCIPELYLQHFMLLVGLKKVDVTMVWCWLGLLGFTYLTTARCYYIDEHKKEENVRYCNEFIQQYFRLELCTYGWVQLTEEEGQSLESLAVKPLKKGLEFNYIGCNDCVM